MSELSQPIADYLEKNQEAVTDGERRTMQAIIERNLVYMSEAQLRQAKYLLGDGKRCPA